MRPDMHKVVVERPRRGSSNNYHLARGAAKRAGRDPIEDDERRTKQGMGLPHKRGNWAKDLSDNLRPLERWLWAQHRRPWDLVWSELSHTIPKGLHRNHIRSHLGIYVAGVPGLSLSTIGYYHRSYPMRVNEAGILLRNPLRAKRYR